MNNTVSNSINDRLNTAYTQIKSIYESTVDLTSNTFIFDTSDNSLTVEKSKFIIDTDLNEFKLGNPDNPDSMILYGTSSATGLDSSAPNGSLYLTQYNNGEGYMKLDNEWVKFGTGDIDYNNISSNLAINKNLTVEDNLTVSNNFDTSGNITCYSLNNNFKSDLNVADTIYSSNLYVDNSGTRINSNSINTNDISCNNLFTTQNITSVNITSNNITSNSLILKNNSIQNTNVDSSGNLDLSGNINVSGVVTVRDNIDSSGIIIKNRLNIDYSGNIDSNGNLNASGNINSLGTVNVGGNVNTNFLKTINPINTTGTITASEKISTSGSLISSTLNINSKLNIRDNNSNVLLLIGKDDITNVNSLVNYAQPSKRKTLIKNEENNNLIFKTYTTFPTKTLDFNGQQYFYYDGNTDQTDTMTDTMNFYMNGGTIEIMFKKNIKTFKSLLALKSNNNSEYLLDIYFSNNNDTNYFYILMNDKNGDNLYNYNIGIDITKWYYLVISFDKPNSKIAIWFGSNSFISQIASSTDFDYITSFNTPTTIIGAYDINDITYKYDGEMANIRFTPDVLYPHTQSEIKKPTFYEYIPNHLDTSGTINASGNISGSSINNLLLVPNSTGFSISGGTTSKTLSVNNTLTLAGTDNTTMTFPSTSQSIVGLTSSQAITNKTFRLSAGTTTQAPLHFTSSSNLLTAPVGGSIEYDGTNYYATSIDSNSSAIRKILPNTNYYRITSDRTIRTIQSTVDVFPTGTFTMDANSYYIIEWHLFIERFSSAIDYIYSVVTSQNPTYVNVESINVLSNNNTMTFGTSTITSLPTTPLIFPGNHYHIIKAYVLNGNTNGNTIKLQIILNAEYVDNIVIKQGSHIFIKKMPNDNFGSFTE